jgi:hypothetical protein
MKVMQAFVDDSRSNSGDREFVLAGYMASASHWTSFSKEWEAELAAAPGIRFFHAVEAANLRGEFRSWDPDPRDEKVLRLASIVQRHPLFSFDCRMSIESFERILEPVSPYDNRSPYFYLFHAVMTTAARQLHIHGLSTPIDFVFDEQGSVGPDAALWNGFMKALLPTQLRTMAGATPSFRSDRDVLPLQAADALAWHLRRSRETRYANEKRPALDLLRREGHVETWIAEPMMQRWADDFARVPGIDNILHKKGSVRSTMKILEELVLKLPKEQRDEAYIKFGRAMDGILKANPELVTQKMEKQKATRKTKRASSSGAIIPE